jgi:putative membrane protein
MTEPLKPRMDFSGTLEQEQQEAFKAAQTFNTTQAEQFSPVVSDMLPAEEGQAEAVVEAALRPKRSLWRRMVSAGLVVAGVTVVGQGVQWAMNAWQTQDWVALGGCAAGALIVGAGVGSIATEWRRLWRLRQRTGETGRAGSVSSGTATLVCRYS